MKQIIALVQKEFKQVFRDRGMLAIIFLIPLIQLFILSYAFTLNVKGVKLLIVDLDNSRISREIGRAFSHTDRFRVVGITHQLPDLRAKFQSWQAQMALVIPTHLGRDLQRHLHPQLQVSVDGVDGNSAGVALGYAQAILSGPSLSLVRATPSPRRAHLVTMVDRMWYNPQLSSKQFIVPGVVVVLLTILPMMLSALSLVKEKELGTLEQLMVTPLRKEQLILGKLIPFLILSFAELGLVMAVAITAFHIPMRGSYPLLALLSLLYLFTTLGLGIFTSTITYSQQQAMFLSWFIMVFMILMSGFFIPIENMPLTLQRLTYLDPMRYFIAIVRDLFQKGSSLPFLLKDILPMAVYGLLIFSFSVVTFHKRVR